MATRCPSSRKWTVSALRLRRARQQRAMPRMRKQPHEVRDHFPTPIALDQPPDPEWYREGGLEIYRATGLRNWTAISWRPLERGLDLVTSQMWLVRWPFWMSMRQVWPTAGEQRSRKEMPGKERSRVWMSWTSPAPAPSRMVRVARPWTGLRLSLRRSRPSRGMEAGVLD